jgi:trimeric autotransporter adhesin
LSANPPTISFGTVATGASATKQIVLTNTGNAAVKIASLSSHGIGMTAGGVTTPKSLNPSESVTITAGFAPTAAGNSTGSITVVSDAANPSLTIPSSGTGAVGDLVISPSSYNFGTVVDGQTKSQTITVSNSGTASLTITQFSATGSAYSVSGLATPTTIAPGASKTFNVLFAPTAAGNLPGSVSITTNASNSPGLLSLAGTGSAASVSLSSSPASISFSNVNSGSANSKTVTISNGGNTSLTISQIAVNAKDFSISGMTAPLTLAAGQNAAMSVTFKPTASENITGNITVSSAQGATSVISVAGSAVQPALAITPSSANFGNVTQGSPATQTIRLSNSGTGTLLVTQLSVTGSGFSTGTLPLPVSLASGQSTTFNVAFAPTSAGTASGSVTVVANAPNSPAIIALSGTGITATQTLTFSASSLAFGSLNVGASSTQSVTVTNSGNSTVAISQIVETGAGFALSGASTPVSLNAGQSLTFGVTFSPNSAGNDSGTVVITSTAAGSPKSIALSGTGVQTITHSVVLTWTSSTSTVAGYNVYRSSTSGSGYGKINSGLVTAGTFDDTNVQNGSTYYYVVTAVDASGNESTDSNQATAAIPQ